MQNLLTITEQDFNKDAVLLDESEYTLREASRAVLFDPEGQVYLMHVTKHGYHKLPGGGIDPGETKEEGLLRELVEEVGCQAKVNGELGQITEYRLIFGNQKQVSYCYTAQQVGEQGESALEEGELAEGMVQVKAKNLAEAIRLLESDRPDNLEGQFIQKRDVTFLKRAQQQAYANV